MSKPSVFAPTPQVSRPTSPGAGDLGSSLSTAGYDKDEDRQGLMMNELGRRDSRERREREKEAVAPTSREQGECDETRRGVGAARSHNNTIRRPCVNAPRSHGLQTLNLAHGCCLASTTPRLPVAPSTRNAARLTRSSAYLILLRREYHDDRRQQGEQVSRYHRPFASSTSHLAVDLAVHIRRYNFKGSTDAQYVVSGRNFTMTFLLLAIQSAVCVIAVWTVKRLGIITCKWCRSPHLDQKLYAQPPNPRHDEDTREGVFYVYPDHQLI